MMPHARSHCGTGLVGALLATVAAAGCGTRPPAPVVPAPGAAAPAGAVAATRTIGVSLLTLDNPFFKVIGDTITAEAAAHDHATVVVSADKDPAKQGNQVKDFIVRGVSAIVLSPCDSRAIVPVIREANAAGIPVFTVDIPCHEPGVEIVTQVCTDNEGGGHEAARAMIEALGPEGGKVAVLHFKQAESCRLRVKGFRAGLQAHHAAGGPAIEIVSELESGGAKDMGAKAAEDALQAAPDLRGIFAINDPAALGAVAAIEKAGRVGQVVVVGFDGQPEGREAIRAGRIHADPVQFPDRMGRRVVEAIIAHSRGEPTEREVLIPTALYQRADALADPSLPPAGGVAPAGGGL